MAKKQTAPFVPASKKLPEFTGMAIALGVLLAVIMGAANCYLGLYAGMTVSASIPAAVISMGILRGILRRGNILQNNIVQTIASAGESLAAGIIFTVPALVLVGAWQDFRFWPTTLIAICGGLLGIVFMIPLRRALICDEEDLVYPEGVACAEVLVTGESGGSGMKTIGKGLVLGGVLKFMGGSLGLIKGSLEWATALGHRIFFIGSDVSAALVGVGYIVNLQIAALVFFGGALAWLIVIPLLGMPAGAEGDALEVAWTLWSTEVRYMGVGAMLVGGIWSLLAVRRGIFKGFASLAEAYQQRKDKQRYQRTERDMSLAPMMVIFGVNVFLLLGLYQYLVGIFTMAVVTTLIMIVASFLFVAVSSYIVGLVGSSNNPVSGMTICALLGTAALFLVLGMTGKSAILATLGVAGVVCCAACSAGDVSQDLKTGHIIGATPRKQQLAQVIGVIISALIMAPTLSMLHHAYGIGTGLKAPQATLFASIANAMFGDAELPYNMVFWGMGVGVALIALNEWLTRRGSQFRTHVMPVAVGIYLPLTLSVPILLGGLIRYGVEHHRKRKKNIPEGEEPGVLFSSGLIAGEAIMGILIAVLISTGGKDLLTITGVSTGLTTTLSLGAIALMLFLLHKAAKEE